MHFADIFKKKNKLRGLSIGAKTSELFNDQKIEQNFFSFQHQKVLQLTKLQQI